MEPNKMNTSPNNKRKLFIVYNRAMSKASRSPEADKLQQRIKLALGILQHHDYYAAEKSLYNPTCSSCNCKDWEFHNSAKRQYHGHCKHMIAEILLERVSLVTYHQIRMEL